MSFLSVLVWSIEVGRINVLEIERAELLKGFVDIFFKLGHLTGLTS
jgi:hypothetical protein